MAPAADSITTTLQACAAGDPSAWDRLGPYIYTELRRLASNCMRHERRSHTLQPTALVHESYLRLVSQKLPQFESRTHFFALAAQIMRQVLVDNARAHRSLKRGSGAAFTPISAVEPAIEGLHWDILALDAALRKLAALSPAQAQAVELHYFAGLIVTEIAATTGRSERSIARDLRAARLFLLQTLGPAS